MGRRLVMSSAGFKVVPRKDGGGIVGRWARVTWCCLRGAVGKGGVAGGYGHQCCGESYGEEEH